MRTWDGPVTVHLDVLIVSPLFKKKMSVVECPATFPLQTRVFLGGGITNCPDWQGEFIERFKEADNDTVLFNPRRRSFTCIDSHEQIVWEFHKLACSDIVVFWFPKESICPIALFEYGKYLNLNGHYKLVVGVHADYPRKTDVMTQTTLATDRVQVHEGWDAFVGAALEACQEFSQCH